MKNSLLMHFKVDRNGRKINVDREFAAPVSAVWAAWTQPEILDLWWAPKPWQTKTKQMEFREGGQWLYAMLGPAGEEFWSFAKFDAIVPQKSFSANEGFCDAQGVVNDSFPKSDWHNTFEEKGTTTMVSIEISYASLADLETIISMGFQEGFTSGMENLDAIFAQQ
jgi:uncharacterized protein YndB with AHSA1/START domain